MFVDVRARHAPIRHHAFSHQFSTPAETSVSFEYQKTVQLAKSLIEKRLRVRIGIRDDK